MDDYRVEFFIFPDGMAIEMIVFDDGHPAGADGGVTDRAHAEASAADCGAAAPAQSTTTRKPAVSHCAEPAPSERPRRLSSPGDEPQRCPVCHSDLVYPTDWERVGSATWNLTLRCPNCETQRTLSLGRDVVERFNKVLYQGSELLARQAELLARRHFEEDVDAFVVALDHDLILPMDF